MAQPKTPATSRIESDSASDYESPKMSESHQEFTNLSETVSPKRIFVKNLDRRLSESEIQSFFQKFGVVSDVRKTRKVKTIAFVTFASCRDALKVLKASNEELILGKRQLSVEAAKCKKANAVRSKTLSHSQVKVSSQGDASWWTVDETIPIHRLPNETLDYVFSFLSIKQRIQTELVCKRWRMMGKYIPWRSPTNLCLDPNKTEASMKKQPLSDGILLAILSRCGISLRQLTLARGDRHTALSGKSVKVVGKHCPNLVEVKLIGLPLTNQCLKVLAQGCSKLKNVSLLNSLDFGEEGLFAFLKRSEALQCLEISKNYQVKGECFSDVSKRLQTLRVNDCPMLQTAALEKLMTRCDFIQELRLTHCHQLEPSVLLKVFHHYKDVLRVVHMDGYAKCVNWVDGLSALRQLKELSLHNCREVNDELLRVLAKKCPKLRTLNIRGTDVTDKGLANLTSAQYLTVLDISEAHEIIGDGIEVLAAQGRLEEVYARASSALILPDTSCGCLARLCPNLRVLDVSGTLAISNVLVETFRASIKDDFLKGNVKLILGGTSVKKDMVDKCERLELCFDNTSQHDLLLDIDYYYDSDDTYDDYSNIDYDFDYYDSSFDGEYGDYDDYDDYADYDDLAIVDPDYGIFDEPFFLW